MTVTALVVLADVYADLNMSQPPPDGGAELQGFIDGAQPVIEDVVGHVVPAAFDDVYNGGDVCIFLREVPVLSITSIVEVIGLTPYNLTLQPVGYPVDNFGYTFDAPSGKITRRSAGSAVYPFYENTGNIEVVYTAGQATVPANVRLATLELIRNWYQNGQQAVGKGNFTPDGGISEDDGYSPTPSGYLIPNRVKALLEPSMRPIVFA